MLILPPGHHNEVRRQRSFSKIERRFIAGAVAALAVLVVAVGFAISGSDPKSGHGCVYVTISSTTGALTIQGCGSKARTICTNTQIKGVYPPKVVGAVQAQCRLAGLPIRD